jgi:predicted tellurium resistance membrane protein TerC
LTVEWISLPEAWIALATLTLLEIVLGIDNIIFISILVGRLPEHQRERARRIGLGVAMGSRILLLLVITWIMRLDQPLFSVLGNELSGRDLILLAGGLFLIGKSTLEIHHALEGAPASNQQPVAVGFAAVIFQIAILDIVFSLDSVITAVGLVQYVGVMIVAIVIAVGTMMIAARPIGDFVDDHPTIKMLALSFLVMIGMALVGEGLAFHIPKGYIYFAMAFSVVVELLNLRVRAVRNPVGLRKHIEATVADQRSGGGG